MFVNFIDLEVNFREKGREGKGKEKLIYSIIKEILDKILRIKNDNKSTNRLLLSFE